MHPVQCRCGALRGQLEGTGVHNRLICYGFYFKLVMRCGAYVGEVIRRNTPKAAFHWLDYKGAVTIDKSIADYGESLGGAAVLWDSNSGLWFPLAKVQKFLDNGRGDSVQFFAVVVIERSNAPPKE